MRNKTSALDSFSKGTILRLRTGGRKTTPTDFETDTGRVEGAFKCPCFQTAPETGVGAEAGAVTGRTSDQTCTTLIFADWVNEGLRTALNPVGGPELRAALRRASQQPRTQWIFLDQVQRRKEHDWSVAATARHSDKPWSKTKPARNTYSRVRIDEADVGGAVGEVVVRTSNGTGPSALSPYKAKPFLSSTK